MAHRVRVNSGYTQVALPNGEVYDGPAEVVLSDDEFNRIRPEVFGSVLTDLGSLPDPDLDAVFATDAEVADVVRKPANPTTIASPTGGTTVDAEGRTTIDSILTVLRNAGLIA